MKNFRPKWGSTERLLCLPAVLVVLAACSGQGNGGGNCSYGCPPAPPSSVTATTLTIAPSGTVGALTTVGGSVTLTATPTPTAAVQSVRFLIDNVQLGATQTVPPFTTPWDTSLITDGAHGVSAIVRDTQGLETVASRFVVVANAITLNVRMSAAEEVATVTTTARGTGTVTVNRVTRGITGTITTAAFRDAVTPVAGIVTPTAVAIREAYAGDNGPVVVGLTRGVTSYTCPTAASTTALCVTTPATPATCTATVFTGCTTATNPTTGATPPTFAASQTLTEASTIWSVPAGTILSVPQMTALTSGATYLNAESARFPAGEARTQIKPANIRVVFANLSGAQEVPAVVTTATGRVAVTVNSDPTARTVTAHVNTDFAAAVIVAAHLHKGFAGSNGGVFAGFAADADVDTDPLTAVPNPAGHFFVNNLATNALTGVAFTATDLAEFAGDEWYANVHTAANPGGEIRGQVVAPMFRAQLSSANEIPPNSSGYVGAVSVVIDPVTLEACVRAVNTIPAFDNISDSHIHIGGATQNGTVVIGFGTNLSNSCTVATTVNVTLPAPPLGSQTGAQIVAGVIANPGGYYYNVHTTTFPGGGMRGQLSRVTQ